jgi:HEAT repeat protein
MRKSRTLSILSVCALMAAHPALPLQSAEPKYQGRSLTKWLSLFREAEADTAQEKRACEAVRAIGTNAVPYLLRMLTNKDMQVQLDAKSGLTILGPIAAPAVPPLAKLLASTNELDMFMAAQALGGIGAPALPVLMETLTNRHYKVATQAYLAIPALGTNARPAIPILLRDLQHPNHFYRERAAGALGGLHIEPEIVVPALTNLLDDPSLAARHLAIQSLGQFGPAARSAVPVMVPFLTNADLSYIATMALREIAPEVLTNRPFPPEKSPHSLSNLLNNPDPAVRSSATNFMRRYGLEQPPGNPAR